MSNLTYESVFRIGDRDWDIVISSPEPINRDLANDSQMRNTVTELFISIVAAANGVERDQISTEHLNATVLRIDENNQTHVETEEGEIDSHSININCNDSIQKFTNLSSISNISNAVFALSYLHQNVRIIHYDHSEDDEISESRSPDAPERPRTHSKKRVRFSLPDSSSTSETSDTVSPKLKINPEWKSQFQEEEFHPDDYM